MTHLTNRYKKTHIAILSAISNNLTITKTGITANKPIPILLKISLLGLTKCIITSHNKNNINKISSPELCSTIVSTNVNVTTKVINIYLTNSYLGLICLFYSCIILRLLYQQKL
ncbi:MAG: hypothetical protein ACD_24C00497G0004 [uncultured bacterium]|nr:MAG: hypothetical protein ACD_24C00497G0004 [uncultured bacterium]